MIPITITVTKHGGASSYSIVLLVFRILRINVHVHNITMNVQQTFIAKTCVIVYHPRHIFCTLKELKKH
jgi:hypothetical protein